MSSMSAARVRAAVAGGQEIVDTAAALVAAGSDPAAIARWFAGAARGLELTEAMGVARAADRGIVLARSGDGPTLAMRAFPPGHHTTIHSHNGWGVLVVLAGRDTYERWEVDGDRATRAATHYLIAGDLLWWNPAPADVHRQGGPDGSVALLLLGSDPDADGPVTYADPGPLPGRTGELAAAYREAYLRGSVDPLTEWFREDMLADICVPHWRFQVQGRHAVSNLLATGELGRPGHRLTMFRAVPTDDGVLVEVEARCHGNDGERLWRTMHLVRMRGDRVAEQTTYCTGHWDAATIARQSVEAGMVRP